VAPDFETVRSQSQKTLIEFIEMDSGLVETFVEIAALAKTKRHMDHYETTKATIMSGVETIQRFVGQVDSVELKAEMARRSKLSTTSSPNSRTSPLSTPRTVSSARAPSSASWLC
jgi:hypothetical protein